MTGYIDIYVYHVDDSHMGSQKYNLSGEGQFDNRRDHQRIKCHKMTCCLGEVVDISEGGMQIIRRGRQLIGPEDAFDAQLHCESGIISLRTQVVWVRKLGFRNWSFGMKFISMSPESLCQLKRLIGEAHDEFSGPQLWIAA